MISILSSIVGAEHVVPLSKLNSAKRIQIQDALQVPAAAASEPVVVYPRSQTELAAVVTRAHREKWRLLICGHRTKLSWGQLAADIDIVISTQWLNRIIDHAAGDLTVTVEAGVPLAALQNILAAEKQFLALDPAYADHATIGGIIATQDSGVLRHRYGGVRDMVLGVTFVRADGELAKAGGRVVKNVAGYDLMKLFTGSFGTLGIMTQVTLRLYPLPETSQTVIFCGDGTDIRQLTQALIDSTLTPTAVEVLSAQFLAACDDRKPLVDLRKAELALAVRFQGIAEGVTAQCEQISQHASLTPLMLEAEPEADFWQHLQAQLWSDNAVICKVGVLPSNSVSVLQQMERLAQKQNVVLQGQFHAGSGLGIIRLEGEVLPVLVEELRSQCQQSQGFLTVLEAPRPLKEQIEMWGYTGNAFASMRKIKEQFDPQALLNPGRFVKGL
ncbi:putative FAD-linked oxidoreductase [Acaryochloris thomasi RCC1774]|uniref:Putative FAD-linked oxidoreductase n=2 Tax=Acaryochloris TaxID=155977 RepID=A0A2W1JYH4_9CYAN|nr:putative FAD-linked oxidoreductase [Acaryochloris thomasi RCC1774]